MTMNPVTILFVEDNADHAELVMRRLGNHPVANRIHHVRDGKLALDYLLRRGDYSDPRKSPRPRVVLLDLRLPKLDGLAVLETIRDSEELEKIPVVILSTSDAESDVVKAYGHHANSYLVKPIDFKEFTKLMDDLGSYWLGWNHYPWINGQGILAPPARPTASS